MGWRNLYKIREMFNDGFIWVNIGSRAMQHREPLNTGRVDKVHAVFRSIATTAVAAMQQS
jgi:hypothetical protein